MKTRFTTRCLAAVLLLAGASLSLSAQDGNSFGQKPSADRRSPPGGPGAPGRFMAGNDGPVMSVLTEEQRTSLREAMRAQQEKVRELTGKLREARRELMMAGLNGKFDEAAVRQQALGVAKLQAEVTVLRAKALSQIQPPLTPGQLEKIRDASPTGPDSSVRPAQHPLHRRISPDTTRDANDLPPKQ